VGDIPAIRADVGNKFKNILAGLQSRIDSVSGNAIAAIIALRQEAAELGGDCEAALKKSHQTLDKVHDAVETAAAKLDGLVEKTPHLDALLATVPAGTQQRNAERLEVIDLVQTSLDQAQVEVQAVVTRATANLAALVDQHQPAIEGALTLASENLRRLSANATASTHQMSEALDGLQRVIETELDAATMAASDESDTMLNQVQTLVSDISGVLSSDADGAINAFLQLSGAYEAFDSRYGEELGQFLETADDIIALIKAIEPVLDLIKALK